MSTLEQNLFDVFSRNWALQETVTDSPTFACPICLKRFHLDQIQELSKEHIPPIKLGGIVQTLTCRKCNNDQGAKLESRMMEYLKLGLFWQYKISNPPKLDFTISTAKDPDTKISVDLLKTSLEGGSLTYNSDRSNPKNADLFLKRISESKTPSFTLHYRVQFNAAMVGFLRMAYLQVFSLLGYSAILHKNYDLVRKQINEPVPLLFPPTWLMPNEFGDEYLGINIVYYPSEIRSLFVVFDLYVNKSAHQKIGVFMPGFDDLGDSIYSVLNPLVNTNVSMATMPLSTFLDMGLLNIAGAAQLVWDACFNSPHYKTAIERLRGTS